MWALSLLAAALLGLDGLARRLPVTARPGGRLLTGAVVAVAVLGVLASAGLAAWDAATALRPQRDLVPAVVADQATGPLAGRMLILSGSGAPVTYRVVGREPGPVVRPLRPGRHAVDPALQAAVQATVTRASAADANVARTRLADLGIGFVALEGRPDPDRLLRLDATAGLTRLGDRPDLTLWRVLPRPAAAGGPDVPSARARLETPQGALLQSVDVAGDHARLRVRPAREPDRSCPGAGRAPGLGPARRRALRRPVPDRRTGSHPAHLRRAGHRGHAAGGRPPDLAVVALGAGGPARAGGLHRPALRPPSLEEELMRGLLRALAVAAVGTGLVAGATHLPGRVDVSAPTVDGAVPPARPVALTRGSAVCPGPQDLGVTGLPAATTVRQRVDLLAAAPPAAALPEGTGRRRQRHPRLRRPPRARRPRVGAVRR